MIPPRPALFSLSLWRARVGPSLRSLRAARARIQPCHPFPSPVPQAWTFGLDSFPRSLCFPLRPVARLSVCPRWACADGEVYFVVFYLVLPAPLSTFLSLFTRLLFDPPPYQFRFSESSLSCPVSRLGFLGVLFLPSQAFIPSPPPLWTLWKDKFRERMLSPLFLGIIFLLFSFQAALPHASGKASRPFSRVRGFALPF